MFPKPSAYVKTCNGETEWIYIFFIEDNELLETYNGIWNKVSNSIKKKILKTKIRSCGDKPAYIHDKQVLKVGSNYTFLTVLLLDSVLKKDKNYYPQVLRE